MTIPLPAQPTDSDNEQISLQEVLACLGKISFREYLAVDLPLIPPLESPSQFEHERFPGQQDAFSPSFTADLEALIDQRRDKISTLELRSSHQTSEFDFKTELIKLRMETDLTPEKQPSGQASLLASPISNCPSATNLPPKRPITLKINPQVTKTAQFVSFFKFLLEDMQEEREFFENGLGDDFVILKEKSAIKFEYLFFEALDRQDFDLDFGQLKSFLERVFAPFADGEKEHEILSIFLLAFPSVGIFARISLALFQSSSFPSQLKDEEFLLLIQRAAWAFFANLPPPSNSPTTVAAAYSWILPLRKYAEFAQNISESFGLNLFKIGISCLEFFEDASKSSHLIKEAVALLCTVLNQIDSVAFFSEEIINNRRLWSREMPISLEVFPNQMTLFNYTLVHCSTAFKSIVLCESFATQLWSTLFSKLGEKQNFIETKSLIDSLLLQLLPFIKRIDLVPGAEFLVRIFIPFAINCINNASLDFVARGKCIDWLGLVLEGIFNDFAPPVDRRQLVIRSFLFESKHLNSFEFNRLDFAFKDSELKEGESTGEAFLYKPLFSLQETIFGIIFRLTNDQTNHYRSKAIKIISSLLQKNPRLSGKGFVLASIQRGINDSSALVREASLDLLSKLIFLNKEFNQTIFSLCLLKFGDSFVSIRRKVLKIVQEFFAHVSDPAIFTQMFTFTLHQAALESDSGIQKQIAKTWSLFLSRHSLASQAIFSLLAQQCPSEANLCDSPCSPTLWSRLLEAFPLENKESITKIVKSALTQLLEGEKFDNLPLLAFLCQFYPEAFVGNLHEFVYFTEVISNEPDPSNQIHSLACLIEIITQIMPIVPFSLETFSKLEKFILFFIVKYPENIANASMKCLVLLCSRSRKFSLLKEIESKFFSLVASPVKSTQFRALINLCNLAYYTRQDIERIFDQILDILSLSPNNIEDLQSVYIHSLGKLITIVPALGVRIGFLIDHFLASSTPQDVLTCLKIFNETLILSDSEVSLKKSTSSQSKSLATDVMNDAGNTGYCSALLQAHFKGILQASLSSKHYEIQSLAFHVMEKAFSLGIIHPIEIIPSSFALTLSPHIAVAKRASILFKTLQEKHRSLVLSKGIESIHCAFLVNPERPNLCILYEIYAAKKGKRNEFFRLILSIFEFSTVNGKRFGTFQFCHFLTRALADLPFRSFEDLFFLLRSLNALCSTLEVPRDSVHAEKIILRLAMLIQLRTFLIAAYGVEIDQIEGASGDSKQPQRLKNVSVFELDSRVKEGASLDSLWELYALLMEGEEEVICTSSKRRRQ